MAKKVYNPKTGKMEWVGDDGKPLTLSQVNPGLGSLPGRATAREAELLARLPDAQLAGFSGPSVVDPRPMRGARPDNPDPTPLHTFRPLAGAKQNNRGNTQLIELPSTGAVEEIVVGSIVETSREAGDDAEHILVTCGVELDTLINPNTERFNIEGLVEWGIGGASFSAEFDWGQGTCFSIAASFIRVGVKIVYQTAPAVQRRAAVSAALAYGSSPLVSASPARKTIVTESVASGFSTTRYGIPNFAVGLTLTGSSQAQPPDWFVGFIGSTASGARNAFFEWKGRTNYSNQRDGTIPIPGWADSVYLTNQSPVADTADMIFSLAL